MKLNDNFILRNIAGDHILIPTGDQASKIKGMICLTGIGGMVIEHLQKDCSREDLVDAICRRYDTDSQTAEKDLDCFLAKMRVLNILSEE